MMNAILSGLALFGLAALMTLPATEAAAQKPTPGVVKSDFGKLSDGTHVELYTLTNKNGMVAKITTYGGIVTSVITPDRNGNMGDVVLGFDNLDGYLKGHPYFGALTGRVANRIAKGKFTLDGQSYTLAVNNGPNHLHGGLKGFDKAIWKATVLKSKEPAISLAYRSVDGEEGYPGNLDVTVVYTLTDKNGLKIEYSAKTDKATPVNLTNHSYFNLAGKGNVLQHEVNIFAKRYTPVDDTLIPTGDISTVVGTPLDFSTQAFPIGLRISSVGGDPKGYDHNYVLDSNGKKFALGARVYEDTTGRILEMYTDEPGVQFYTGNFLDGTLTGKGGEVYKQYSGFCLEAQHFPDAVNKSPIFPTVILRPGETYKQTTEYRFSVKK